MRLRPLLHNVTSLGRGHGDRDGHPELQRTNDETDIAMTKEQIEAIIAPVHEKIIEKKKRRAARLSNAVAILNQYCDGHLSSVLVIASDRRKGTVQHTLTIDNVETADVLLLLGIIKTIEKQLVDGLRTNNV
jgi:hypothetical protein